MRTFQNILEASLENTTAHILSQLLDEKLAAQGIALGKNEREKLVEHVLGGATGSLKLRRWQWWDKRDITLTFDEDDATRIEGLTDKLVAEVPGIIAGVTEESVERMLEALLKTWPGESRDEGRELAGFRKRLAVRWEKPLQLLRLMSSLAREFGETLSAEPPAEAMQSPHRTDALTRLQARACRVVSEVIVLLEAGLSEGAISRWRALHEVATVAMFISDGEEILAERYLNHVLVEELRAAREYRVHASRLGLEPLSDEEFAALEVRRNELVSRFGKAYGEQYGWAAELLRNPNPGFADVERAVGLDHLRPLYRMASHSIHPNPMGIYFHPGLTGREEFVLTGPSETGLGEPLRFTAASLSQACVSLLKHNVTLDHLVMISVMSRLVDHVKSAVDDVEAQILPSLSENEGGGPDEFQREI